MCVVDLGDIGTIIVPGLAHATFNHFQKKLTLEPWVPKQQLPSVGPTSPWGPRCRIGVGHVEAIRLIKELYIMLKNIPKYIQ
jgi:hypothetical protein